MLNQYFKNFKVKQALIAIAVFGLTACGNSSDTTVTNQDGTTTIVNSEMAALGKKLFEDVNLSSNGNQSCASCHLSTSGFAEPDSQNPVSEGSIAGRFGNRNAPTASYAAFIPDFTQNNNGNFEGGQFLDGRASTLEDQAKLPFLNPLEMNNASEADVVQIVSNSTYAADFQSVFGANIFNDVDTAYDNIAEAIATFERSSEVSPFTSKFDAELAGTYTFTAAEQRGQNLFNSNNGGNCRRCHSSGNDNNNQVFSDFSYQNVGTPPNPNNPFLTLSSTLNPDGASFVDLGLGSHQAGQDGRFRVSNLRNIAETAPYMHNGVFSTLTEVVEFYNTRNANDAEVTTNINDGNARGNDIGNLNLSTQDISDIVAFLNTLSDGFSN